MATDTLTGSSPHKIWVEDGILYNEFQNEFSVEAAFEVEKKSALLLKERAIEIIPLIILLKDIDESKFKFQVSDYGKMVAGFELVKHVSGIWIIGVTPQIKNVVNTFNKLFFANRMHLVSSLEEAQTGARALLASPVQKAILDKE